MNIHIDPVILARIEKSKMDGGVFYNELPDNAIVVVTTRNTKYYISKQKGTIHGHPKYCPEPTKCHIIGSSWGGGLLKIEWIGKGMLFEFVLEGQEPLTTSEVVSVEVY